MRFMLKSKIHHAVVTDWNVDYIWSIFIDEDLMERSNIIEYERVDIVNVSNWNRWQTYAVPVKKLSWQVILNWWWALLWKTWDKLIIMSYELTNETKVNPKMILVNEKNEFVENL